MAYSKQAPSAEAPVKLTQQQYENWSEQNWRLEVEKQIAQTKLANQTVNREMWYKAFFLAGQFNHIKSNDDAVKLARLIHDDFLGTENVEFNEPQKPLNLVK